MEIKNHIFFSPINWDDLCKKKITPPYKPNVVSVVLLSHEQQCYLDAFSFEPIDEYCPKYVIRILLTEGSI